MIVHLGQSVEGRPIDARIFRGELAETTLVLAAVHGDEPKTVFVAGRLIELLADNASIRAGRRWVILPTVNPDGYERRRRRNANRVDINRNFPTGNWSCTSRRSRMFGGGMPAGEPETKAVIKAVERYRPTRIITIHSIDGQRFCNNYDGPAGAWARRMARLNHYPVRRSIGYATPGSFGTWAGRERGIPTITLELPSHHSSKRCWEDNRAALVC